MDVFAPLSQFVSVSDATHKKWISTLKEGKILFISAMFGCGKTSQIIHFAKTYFLNWAYFQAEEEDFWGQVETFVQQFQRKTGKTLLILDDIQWLYEKDDQQRLANLLSAQAKHGKYLQIALLCNGSLPEYLISFRIAQRLTIADRTALLLNESQIAELFSKEEALQHLSPKKLQTLVSHCMELTGGCALLVQIYLQRICDYPNDAKTAAALAMRDVFFQLEHQLFGKWPKPYREALVRLGATPSFSLELADLLLGKESRKTISFITQLDGFLEFTAPDMFHFHPTIAWYFSVKLEKSNESLRKEIYGLVAEYYEKRRDFQEALRCYQLGNRMDKIEELVVYLLENADGCMFAKLSEKYIDLLTPEMEEKNPSIIGAKAMLAAYRMDPETSKEYIQKLKALTKNTTPDSLTSEALSVYIRTYIASPCVDATELKENLLLCAKYVQKNGIALQNIMPTSNSASILNGGIDLLTWIPHKNTLFPVMKQVVTAVLGVEGIGVPDACLGELLYEQNKAVQSMASLTHALSDANFKGSIRVQYAITGIMARLLQSEGQLQASKNILTNIYEQADELYYSELLPNIKSSLVHCALLANDTETFTSWLQTESPNEHDTFYITVRYELFEKARVYAALGRDLEALYIVDILQQYADLYHRHYMQIDLLVLRAILLYRREEDWQTPLFAAVKQGASYGLIRVFADQGIALLPLWKQLDWINETDIKSSYANAIEKEILSMASQYPKYLQPPHSTTALTDREFQVLLLMSQGAKNAEISKTLEINLGTTKFHVSNIIKKMGAENRTSATKIAQEKGLI